jgi:hypothetical protein
MKIADVANLLIKYNRNCLVYGLDTKIVEQILAELRPKFEENFDSTQTPLAIKERLFTKYNIPFERRKKALVVFNNEQILQYPLELTTMLAEARPLQSLFLLVVDNFDQMSDENKNSLLGNTACYILDIEKQNVKEFAVKYLNFTEGKGIQFSFLDNEYNRHWKTVDF